MKWQDSVLPTLAAPSQATGALSTAANAADGAAASGAQPAPSGGGASPTEPGPLPQQQQQSAASTSGRPASPLGGGGGNSESRSMADSRVKKFHKLLGEHVVRSWQLGCASASLLLLWPAHNVLNPTRQQAPWA